MAAMVQRPVGTMRPAEDDIYTALLIIATLFIVVATVCLAYQFHTYYGLGTIFSGTPGQG